MNYFNSTIKVKYGVCPECDSGKSVPLKSGLCFYHYGLQMRLRSFKEASVIKKKMKFVSSDKTLDDWFAEKELLLSLNPFCQECGERITPRAKNIEIYDDVTLPYSFRDAVAHIFPKSIFKTVATHPSNYLFLGAGCGCHHRSHRLDTFSKMKVFKIAVEKFLLFAEEITEKHKYLNQFIEYATTLK